MPIAATIYASELEHLAGYVNAFPRLETGGELWGYVTRSGSPVVTLVTGPGQRARHHVTAFFQDVAILEQRAAFLFEKHALYQVGNWHSHHALGLREPSEGDDETVRRSLPKLGWPTFLMGLGNVEGPSDASFGFYTYDARGHRFDTAVTVLPGQSPMARFWMNVPGWLTASRVGARYTVRPPRGAWFQQPAASKRLAREIRGLQRLAVHGWSSPEVRLRDGDVHVSITAPQGSRVTALLEAGFPTLAPRVRRDGESHELAWRDDDLLAEHLALLSVGNSPAI